MHTPPRYTTPPKSPPRRKNDRESKSIRQSANFFREKFLACNRKLRHDVGCKQSRAETVGDGTCGVERRVYVHYCNAHNVRSMGSLLMSVKDIFVRNSLEQKGAYM
jgi:hypothetical protein